MHFPVEISIFGRELAPHAVLEVLAYGAGFGLYRMLRNRFVRSRLSLERTVWVLVGCIFGALAGSKSLAWLESIDQYAAAWRRPEVWLGAQTIVGALLGGWIGVEIAKKKLGVGQSTGDVFVFPLILGMAVGRVGCFLSGLADHTYGIATSLPWGVDFGDGVYRHPTQLYEIIFLGLLALALLVRMRYPYRNGTLFRLFMLGYLSWRLFIDFYKPGQDLIGPFSAIQSACIAGMVACVVLLWHSGRHTPAGCEAGGATLEQQCPTAPTSSTS